MIKHRRWLTAAIDVSKTADMTLPWQRASKPRPFAFKHLQMQIPPKPKAAAARGTGRPSWIARLLRRSMIRPLVGRMMRATIHRIWQSLAVIGIFIGNLPQ